jgi:hypothetical protein
MIKRYILHIETHWRYRPRISFKKAPKAGDRVVDGGIPGTLKLCPTCQEGFLHEPDLLGASPRVKKDKKRKTPFWAFLLAEVAKSATQPRPYSDRPYRSYHTPRPAMDFNVPTHVRLTPERPNRPVRPTVPTHVELKEEPKPSVVKLTVDDEDPILKKETTDKSPETLELDYTLGTHEYEQGDEVWTHHAKYIVDKLEDNVLYLVRKDVWKARKKKGSHVELKADGSAEHVELKVEDEEEKSSGPVVLKFD